MHATPVRSLVPLLAVLATTGCEADGVGDRDGGSSFTPANALAISLPLDAVPMYHLEFVATAAGGVDHNDVGEVVGGSYAEDNCGPFCLPPYDTVVWSGGDRLVLDDTPGLVGAYAAAIDPAGRVAGHVGLNGTTTHATIWDPNGAGGYTLTDLGTLPGATISESRGIDDAGRVIGFSSTLTFPPSVSAPFVWTDADGMVDLSALGAPTEWPYAVSPGGMVATTSHWYHLDDPATVFDVAPPPRGFMLNAYPIAINDSGEQARFLVSTSAENLVYLYRYHTDGTWNQISPIGTGHLSSYGLGSMTEDGTVTATVASTGMIAFGFDGEAEPLAPYVSPAYNVGTLTSVGTQNALGEILAKAMIGASSRLVRLIPTAPCEADCLVVDNLTLKADFVEDPQDPGHCFEHGNMFNRAKAKVTVTDEFGVPLAGVDVSGRFLDDYWTDDQVSGVTNANGEVTFKDKGPCGVGTIAFFVDDVQAAGRTFDRTVGTLVDSMIPQ